jgi:GNAT superfamily N-acetyltransferase
MSGRQLIATRTFLEMRDPSALRPAVVPAGDFAIVRLDPCPPAVWRFLYVEVGRRYRWIDRLDWTDDQARAYLEDPAVSVWLLTVDSTPAGYFELRRDADGSIEIAYFGLMHAFQGRGLGGHLLTVAAREAWAAGANRVWLHTSTLDHPAALPNYLSRGFTVVRSESYIMGV